MVALKGVIPAAVTPFTQGGREIDIDWIPQHLEYLRQWGADGVLILGTNGEGPSVGLEEKKRIIDIAVANKKGLAVIVSSGCSALIETIHTSNYAFDRGADAVLIVPPFYFKNISQDGLSQYYHAVFRSLPAEAKVYLYNIPSLSGVEISDELIDALLQSYPERLLGVKDTSGRLEKTIHYIHKYRMLSIFAGSDQLAGPSLKAGASGCISAVANVFPDLVKNVYQAHLTGGDIEGEQARLSQVRQLFSRYPSPSVTKHLLRIVGGLPLTYVRPPMVDLTPDQVTSLEAEIRQLQLKRGWGPRAN